MLVIYEIEPTRAHKDVMVIRGTPPNAFAVKLKDAIKQRRTHATVQQPRRVGRQPAAKERTATLSRIRQQMNYSIIDRKSEPKSVAMLESTHSMCLA